jgi:hypothetical protein
MVMTRNNVLALLSRTMIHRTISHLDGRPFASAGFAGPMPPVWEWVQETVAHELECSPEQVGIMECEDRGDVVTVDGLPVYLLC